ncbi:hypothetical protein MPSEU_000457200 [Mayamaea pseudoterrestris]|nr:hypothetical protein MPSEU_000457200 [Mayamaea pseudoterrestris]
MADHQLEINDAVFVSVDGRQLEGVLAWFGNIDNDDMMGVRLTGGCVGLGNNNGSLHNEQYFDCPPNCGIFAPSSAVTKRPLTKLEELRLKRELSAAATKKPAAAAGPASSSSSVEGGAKSATTTPRKTGNPPKADPKDLPPVEPAKATISKLEELRLRRAALKEKMETKTTVEATISVKSTPVTSTARKSASAATRTVAAPVAATAATSITSPAAALQAEEVSKLTKELEQLKRDMTAVQARLGDKEHEASLLQSKLSLTEQELHKVKAALEEATSTAAAASAPTMQTNQVDPQVAELQAQLAVSEQALQNTVVQLEQAKVARRPQVIVSNDSTAHDETVATLQSLVEDWKQKAQEAFAEITNVKKHLEQDKQQHETAKDELIAARAEAAQWRQELQMQAQQSEQRGTANNSHYKERAKLQAELGTQKRKVETLEREKLDLEATIEDLTLDKEQLLEEKEALEDRVDELRLDAETAQMEVEELKMELDDARHVTAEAAGSSQNVANEGAEEMATALSTQNARLREALIRLREQTQFEKMELLRLIRDAEKEAESGRALSNEVAELRLTTSNQEEQITDLKEMVEQGAAFEQMVEDLTDRLFSLEEECVALKTVVRELEEAAELTAEMEEVQAEELKALSRDLEGREAVIHNLEEAIKIQRRREEDFLRTVGNYRTTVAKLNHEKQALLELHQGGEGEKTDLIAASQNALARASQLVSEAAAVRKREAQAVLDSIDKEVYRDLALRLESLLPQNIVGLEVSAIRGELLTAKVVNCAAKTLRSISNYLTKATLPGLVLMEGSTLSGPLTINLSDDVRRKASSMLYQAEFAHTVVDASSNLIRFLAATLWPDLLSQEASATLASSLGHSVEELDFVMGGILRSITEEGDLSPEHANLGSLQQTVTATMQRLKTDIERENDPIVPEEWNPPGWELMRDISIAGYACQGAAATLSLVVHELGHDNAPTGVAVLHSKLEQASTRAHDSYRRLSLLDINNESLVSELSDMAASWKAATLLVFNELKLHVSKDGDLGSCFAAAEDMFRTQAQLTSALRPANFSSAENDEQFHALSPQDEHSWTRLATLCKAIRSVDGDEDDINYMARARDIEHQFTEAIENRTKLATANARLGTMEKTLATKSKEVMLQTARLSELEKEIAKGGSFVNRTIDLKSSDEFERLTEENRVLHDAMQHWQTQAEEYQAALKDIKSPAAKGQKNVTPRRGLPSASDMTPSGPGVADGRHEDVGLLEATLYRPALQQALRDASKWKAAAIASHLQDLLPLRVPSFSLLGSPELSEPLSDGLIELTSAVCNYRLVKASSTIIDLTNTEKSARAQLRESHRSHVAASERLHSVISRCNSIAIKN